MTKRYTKMEKVEKIHSLNGRIETVGNQLTAHLAKKSKKPFRIEVKENNSFKAYGIQPTDFSEETQIRLQKYYTRIIRDELKTMTSERDRLMRLLR